MKKPFFLLLLLSCFSAGKAQVVTTCGIYFDYDNAGNRIKRYYDCKTFDPNAPPETDPIGGETSRKVNSTSDQAVTDVLTQPVVVYPNPATEYFMVKFPEVAPNTHFHFYDAKGSIIASGDMNEQEYRCNVGSIAPGMYHLYVLYKGKQYSFKITKL